MNRIWNAVIDLTTLAWLGVFVLSLAGPAGWGDFFRRAWLDLLMLIPFVRVFRAGRVTRFLKVNRLSRLFRGKNICAGCFGQRCLSPSRRVRIWPRRAWSGFLGC